MRFSILILLLLFGRVYGQIDANMLQFPYQNYCSGHQEYDDDEFKYNEDNFYQFMAESPYRELIRNNHIKTITRTCQTEEHPEYSIGRTDYFYFNERGLPDSIHLLYYYTDSIGTDYYGDIYNFKYSNNDSLIKITYNPYSQNPVIFEMDYSGKQTVTSHFHIKNYDLYTRYFLDDNGFISNIIISTDSLFSDTISQNLASISHPRWDFAMKHILHPPFLNTTVVIDSVEFRYAINYDMKGRVESQIYYNETGIGRYTYETQIENIDKFWYNRMGVLWLATRINMKQYNLKTDTLYYSTFNELSLPDTVFIDQHAIVYSYEFHDNFQRWSPINFRHYEVCEMRVDRINKLGYNETKTIYPGGDALEYAIIRNDYIQEYGNEDGEFWLSNDYLVKAVMDDGSVYRFHKDTLVSFEKVSDKKLSEAKILKKADEILKSVYNRCRELQPGFGVRVQFDGIEPDYRESWDYDFDLVVKLDSISATKLKAFELNDSTFNIKSFEFTCVYKASSSNEYYFPRIYYSAQIPEFYYKCVNMNQRSWPEFYGITIMNKQATRSLDPINFYISKPIVR